MPIPLPGANPAGQDKTEINPGRSGLPPDAPKGTAVVPNGDQHVTDRSGRVVQMPSAIRPAATPERTGQPVPRGPAGGRR